VGRVAFHISPVVLPKPRGDGLFFWLVTSGKSSSRGFAAREPGSTG